MSIRSLFIFLILLAGVVAVYQETIHYPFHLDDRTIALNPRLHLKALDGTEIVPILSGNRPVSNLTFALNFYFGGFSVAGYHAVNIAIHVLNGWLVYFLFFRTLSLSGESGSGPAGTGNREWLAGFGALLWALHPVQTQAVTYLVQRMALLAAFFYLLSLTCYIEARRRSGMAAALLYFMSAAAALLALGSKENAWTLPVMIVLYEWYFLSRFDGIEFKKELPKIALFLFLLAGGVTWLALIYRGHPQDLFALISANYATFEIDPLIRVMTEWRVLLYYVTLLVFPFPGRLNLDYDFPLSLSLFSPPTTIISFVVLLAGTGFALVKARQMPLLSFSILWFLINLATESTVIKLDLVFEHRLYLPSILLFLAGPVYLRGFGKRSRIFGGASLGLFGILLLLLFGTWSYQRNQVWQSEISLWSDVLKKSPNSLRALQNGGDAFLREGDPRTAIRLYLKLLSRTPENGMIHNDLGIAYQATGDLRSAFSEFQKAAEIDPRLPDPHQNLGILYLLSNQIEAASGEFRSVIAIDPGSSRAHTNLGIIYDRMGRRNEAGREFQKGIEADPRSSFGQFNYAYFLESSGEKKGALEHYQEALKWAELQGEMNPGLIREKIRGLQGE